MISVRQKRRLKSLRFWEIKRFWESKKSKHKKSKHKKSENINRKHFSCALHKMVCFWYITKRVTVT